RSAGALATVPCPRQHPPGRGEEYRPHRHVAALAGLARLRQRQTHRFLVGAHTPSLPATAKLLVDLVPQRGRIDEQFRGNGGQTGARRPGAVVRASTLCPCACTSPTTRSSHTS